MAVLDRSPQAAGQLPQGAGGGIPRHALEWSRVEFDDEDLERVEQLADAGGLDLDRFLDRLPDEQRSALVERVPEERDYPAIAADMACSEMLVRQRVHRGSRHLRRMLEEPE